MTLLCGSLKFWSYELYSLRILRLELGDLGHDLRQRQIAGADVDENAVWLHKGSSRMIDRRRDGAVSRARTSDFKIFSLALSQLSYHGVIPPYRCSRYKVCDGVRHDAAPSGSLLGGLRGRFLDLFLLLLGHDRLYRHDLVPVAHVHDPDALGVAPGLADLVGVDAYDLAGCGC